MRVEPNPHDRLLERAWENARRALALCRKDEGARQRALSFAQQAQRVSPTLMQLWVEILNGGQKDHLARLQSTPSFFDLSGSEQAWWDRLLQSAPFAPVLQASRSGFINKNSFVKSEPGYMTLEQFDHICRAAAAVAGVQKVFAFGANAILPWLAENRHPIPLPNFVPSRELDVSVDDEKLDALIDGAIGELSAFDETFSVYAHGLSLASFQAPAHWQQRAHVRSEPASGVEIIVPHPHDLMIAKLAAGRPKDFEFACATAWYFPLSEAAQQKLMTEFEAAYPNLAKNLRENFQRWQILLQQQSVAPS